MRSTNVRTLARCARGVASNGSTMSWIEYWNEDTAIYVNARHRQVHYEVVARDFLRCLPRGARVVDYGCGDALSAHLVADACSHLFLCDSAPSVRNRLADRYLSRPDISVVSPQQFHDLPDGTIDAIVANSVVQYFSIGEFKRFLAVAYAKLARSGRLILADIIPQHVGPVTDAIALLKFAQENGFLLPAAAGLLRTFFSSYRRTRAKFGLLQFEEQEVIDLLDGAGFRASRHHPNFGHNAQRLTLVAHVEKACRPAEDDAPEATSPPGRGIVFEQSSAAASLSPAIVENRPIQLP